MPKYYVVSGDLNVILDREFEQEAAMSGVEFAVESEKEINLSQLLKVSEIGSEGVYGEDLMFLTDQVIEDAGLSHFFEESTCEE